MATPRPTTVDEYIMQAPAQVRDKLRQLRQIIKKAAPAAEEKVSYGMPYFGYRGRLAYFAVMKNHIGLYIPPPIIAQHESDLKSYTTTKSAIHLPLQTELPAALITKLVKARMRWNEKADL